MYLAVLSVLLACAVSLSSSAVVLENGLPILWAHTTDQLSDLPKQNDILNPDPWHYLHRMSLYRLLIAATDPYMGSMGTGQADNSLWGLPLELAWMVTSGRLADPTGATTCGLETGDTMCISTNSWWGCVNYLASALPFLSAAQQGLMGPGLQVQMQVPAGVEDFCTTYTDCATRFPDIMSKWDAFFQALKTAQESTLPANEKKDALLGLQWEAHLASTHSSSACSTRKSYYSSTEQSFFNSWLNSAEFVAAVRFHSNIAKTVPFITPLPGRVLQESDSLADLSQEERHTLSIFSWIQSINSFLGGSLVSMWQRSMCSVDTREKGRNMLEQLLLNPSFATGSFVSLVTGAASC